MASRLSFLGLCLLALVSCAAQGQRLESRSLTIVRADGSSVRVNAELARSEEERNIGLMFRKKLADGTGMLFVFEYDRQLAFWMKNTLVPLSIAFIASDGRITEIRDMQAQALGTITSERSVRYALEVPQGWFSRAGVRVGDRLSLEALAPRI